MSSFDETFKRIQLATNTKTQMELAEVLGIKQSSISDAKRRGSVPADWYMKLFEKFGLNPHWLKQGTEPICLATGVDYEPLEESIRGLAEDSAPYGDLAVKSVLFTVCGTACEYSDEAVEAPMLPAVAQIMLPMSFAASHIMVLRMDAPNMEPCIMRHALVGVDTTVTRPISGTVYAVYSPYEGIQLKRLFLNGDTNCYLLRSDAAGYPETTLEADILKKRLMGKVAWVLQHI